MNVFNAVITLLLTPYSATRIHCKTVRIFAYSSTREQSNKRSGTRLKTRERLERDVKNTLALPWVPEVLLACGGNFRNTSSAASARLSPSSGSRRRFCRRTATSTHFRSSRNTTLHRETTLTTALELLDTEFTKRFEAKCRQ